MIEFFAGSKEGLGIETRIMSQNAQGYYLGYARLWLCGKFLGTIEDYIYIDSYLLKGLKKLLSVPILDDSHFQTLEDKYNYFMTRDNDLNDDEIDKHKINFGTMSDSFTIRAYKRSDELIIMWRYWKRLEDNQFPDLQDYGNNIHECKVAMFELSKYVSFLEKILLIPDILSTDG